MAFSDFLSDGVKKIKPYPAGKPIEEVERELGLKGVIKLASNENPLGPSPKAVEAIKKALPSLNRYPDGGCYYLKNRLAAYHGVETNNLIIGNGSNEIIDLIAKTFIRPGDEGLSSKGSFVIYQMVILGVDGLPVLVDMRDYCYDLEGIYRAISPRTKVIFIANPNNPTGTFLRGKELDEFFSRLSEKQVVAVLDEAYYEFVCNEKDYRDGLDYFRKYPNVIVLRTLSKVQGLAGLRIGYGIGNSQLIEYINRLRQPFNVNRLAQVAALAGIDDREFVEKYKKLVREGLLYLYREFEKLKLKFIKSYTNFVMVDLKKDSATVYEALLREGVIIRPLKAWGFPTSLRITVGLPEENKKLITALKKVL